MPEKYLIITSVIVCCHTAAQTSPKNQPEEIIHRAIAAIGGDQVIALAKHIRVVSIGNGNPGIVYQSRFPDRDIFFHNQETLILDAEKQEFAYREEFEQPNETPGLWLTVVKKDKGAAINIKSQRTYPMSAAAATAAFQNYMWRIPHLALDILRNQISHLQYQGIQWLGHKRYSVLTFQPTPGKVLKIYFDSDNGLPAGYSYPVENLNGIVDLSYMFKAYRKAGRLNIFPSGYTLSLGNKVYLNLTTYDVRPSDISNDPWIRSLDKDLPAGSGIRAQTTRADQIAPHAWIIRNIGGYNIMVTEIEKGLVVIDAPASYVLGFSPMTMPKPANLGELLVDEIKKDFPGKKILYAVPTHHHRDHFGGIKALANAGATIVTTPGNITLTHIVAGNVKIKPVNDSLVL
ncbi:MAG TPA: MBL fold metallo-hydrolase, partial [Puia sp.]|nr:MBL fold metallo-hydrolase [Puia sp.]